MFWVGCCIVLDFYCGVSLLCLFLFGLIGCWVVVGVLLVWMLGLSVMNICCLITSVVGCLFGFCLWVELGLGWVVICWGYAWIGFGGLGGVLWWFGGLGGFVDLGFVGFVGGVEV